MAHSLRECEHVCGLDSRMCCECEDISPSGGAFTLYLDGTGIIPCFQEDRYCYACRNRIRELGWGSDKYLPDLLPPGAKLKCGHNCHWNAHGVCCSCTDTRPVKPRETPEEYEERTESYCPECQERGPRIAAKRVKRIDGVAEEIDNPTSIDVGRECLHECASTSKNPKCCICEQEEVATSGKRVHYRRKLCAVCKFRQSEVTRDSHARTSRPHKTRHAGAVGSVRATGSRSVCAPSAPAEEDPSLYCLNCGGNDLFVSTGTPKAVVCVTCQSVYPEGTFPMTAVERLPLLPANQESRVTTLLSSLPSRHSSPPLPSSSIAATTASVAPVTQSQCTYPSSIAATNTSGVTKALTQACMPSALACWADALLEELSCSVCLEPFLDPMTLQCGHSVCKKCLATLKKCYIGPGVDRIACPVCRAVNTGVSKMNVSTELAFVISVVQSWTRGIVSEAAAADTLVDTAEGVIKSCASGAGDTNIHTPP